MSRFATLLIGFIIGCGAMGLPGRTLGQQGPWYQGFEGPDVSWRSVGGNAPFRTELHQRIRGEAHTGDGCERLRIAGLAVPSHVTVRWPADLWGLRRARRRSGADRHLWSDGVCGGVAVA